MDHLVADVSCGSCMHYGVQPVGRFVLPYSPGAVLREKVFCPHCTTMVTLDVHNGRVDQVFVDLYNTSWISTSTHTLARVVRGTEVEGTPEWLV